MISNLTSKYSFLVLLASSQALMVSSPALKVSSVAFSLLPDRQQGGKRQGGEQGEVACLPSGGRPQSDVLRTQQFCNIFICHTYTENTCVSRFCMECYDSLVLFTFVAFRSDCLDLGIFFVIPLFTFMHLLYFHFNG